MKLPYVPYALESVLDRVKTWDSISALQHPSCMCLICSWDALESIYKAFWKPWSSTNMEHVSGQQGRRRACFLEPEALGANPDFASYRLCDLGQII